MRSKPAVTLHQKGQGRVVHFGSFFTPQNVSALLDALAIEDPLATWADIPAEIQAVVRSNGDRKVLFSFELHQYSAAGDL